MALKRRVKKLDDIPEAFRDAYKSDGDEWVLEVEGDSGGRGGDDKLREFRDNNNRLRGELDELKSQLKRFEGVDPDKHKKGRDALKKLADLEERELVENGRWEELVSRRTQAMREEFDTRWKARDEKDGESKTRTKKLLAIVNRHVVSTEIDKVLGALKIKLRPGAMPDLESRASQVWRLGKDDQTLEARNESGAIFGTDGEPLTMEGWAKKLVQTAPHLFEGSAGGGAEGGATLIPGGAKEVAHTDAEGFGANLEDIAKGKVKVK